MALTGPRGLFLRIAAWAVVLGAFGPASGRSQPAMPGPTTDDLDEIVAREAATIPAELRSRPLRIGVHPLPPMVIPHADRPWSGFAIDVWEAIARRLGLTYELVPLPYEQLLPALSDGRLDAVAAIVTASAAAEMQTDFTHPVLQSGISAAVRWDKDPTSILTILADSINPRLLAAAGAVMVALFAVSVVLWLLERRANAEHFGGHAVHGLGSALWFAAVTMTSVGYGDKTPRTLAGRVLSFLWMLFGIVLITTFTATIVSTVTAERIRLRDSSLHVLAGQRLGVIRGSRSGEILDRFRMQFTPFETLEEGLDAVEQGKIFAFIGPDISLRYVVGRDFSGVLQILPLRADGLNFCMAFPNRSPLTAPANLALLDILEKPVARDIKAFYQRP